MESRGLVTVNASQVDIVSPLPYAECERRLKQALGSSPNFVGTARNGTVLVRKIGRGRNSFRLHLMGELYACDGGTLIKCRFGMRPLVKAIMVVWLSLAAVGGILIPQALLMLVIGAAIALAGWHATRSDAEPLAGYVQWVVEGRRVSDGEYRTPATSN